MPGIGILGGTFDPIHFAHLRSALEAQQQLGLERVHFIPCRIPPHKSQTYSDSDKRLAMVKLAVEDQPGFEIDTRELEQEAISYSVLTLESLRRQYGPERPLCFIMGMDSWLSFTQWHQWQAFTHYAHVVVAPRPGYDPSRLPDEQQAFFRDREEPWASAQTKPCGSLQWLRAHELEISSTAIRQQVGSGKSPRYLLPDPVWHYIETYGLYCNDATGNPE